MPEPVTVTVEVARPRQEVFDYVDVAANHERWMDHFFKDWRFLFVGLRWWLGKISGRA